MKLRDKYKPYIRRMRGDEKGGDFRTDLRLCLLAPLKPYVMVQRGFPRIAIAVARSKKEIKESIFTRKKFNDWANSVKCSCQKGIIDKLKQK